VPAKTSIQAYAFVTVPLPGAGERQLRCPGEWRRQSGGNASPEQGRLCPSVREV